jgi:adenosylcobinamide-phosphate synthase
MSFISVLLALLLEQARPLARANAVHAAMRAWVRWASRNVDAGTPAHGWLTWTLAVGAPALLAWVIYALLARFVGWWVEALWTVAVLYATLGFRQFSFHFTQIRDALVNGDDEAARSHFGQWRQLDASNLPERDLIGRVIEFSVLSAHRHVFGVLLWFSVLAAFGLGPMGAVFYRLAEFVARYWQYQQSQLQPVSPAAHACAQSAWERVDWLPARLTAIAFAVVGNFEEAIDGWRRQSGATGLDNDTLILAATAGAVGLQLPSVAVADEVNTPRGAVPEVAHLAVVVGLVWRTVVMWIVMLALLTLARLLG